jgi:hypothetical protein
MPQLLKDLTAEHIMRFTGSAQELDKLDKAAAELHVNDEIKKKVLSGQMVNLEFQMMAREEAIKHYRKTGTNRFLKIKENFYKNTEYDFDFNIDNEQIDPATSLQGIETLFGFLQNPAVLQDPRLKMLFYKAAEDMGISPAEIEFADNQATEMQASGQLPTLQGSPPEGQSNPAGQLATQTK